jgi:hypothetical protein
MMHKQFGPQIHAQLTSRVPALICTLVSVRSLATFAVAVFRDKHQFKAHADRAL